MFPSNIVLPDFAAANKTFVLTSQGGQNSIRVDNGSSNTAPRRMLISHNISTLKGGLVVDRHLLSFQITKINAAGQPVTMIQNRSLQFPRDPIFDTADVKDLRSFDQNFIYSDSNLNGWLLGEY